MSTTTLTTPRTTNNLIQVRVPADLKERTAKLFERLGTNTSDVIRMMLKRADETQSIPFSIRTTAYPITAEERIEEVKATFALEGMPLDEQNIKDLEDIESGKVTTEEVRQRIITNIKRRHQK